MYYNTNHTNRKFWNAFEGFMSARTQEEMRHYAGQIRRYAIGRKGYSMYKYPTEPIDSFLRRIKPQIDAL